MPVIATLTSRPAHAWNCQAASAWGSVVANPNASFKRNANQQLYSDETWTLTNWVENASRTSVADDNGRPWNRLKRKFPAIEQLPSTKDKKGKEDKKDKKDIDSGFDYESVTVGDLQSTVSGFVTPLGASPNAKVVELMKHSGADFVRYCVAAQLNYILLSAGELNGMENCVTLTDLKNMALGMYPPIGKPWDDTMVVKFLNDNWIVRVS